MKGGYNSFYLEQIIERESANLISFETIYLRRAGIGLK